MGTITNTGGQSPATDIATQYRFPATDVRCRDIVMRRRQARASPNLNGIDYVEVDKANHKVILRLLKPAIIHKSDVLIGELEIRSCTVMTDEKKPAPGKNRGAAGKLATVKAGPTLPALKYEIEVKWSSDFEATSYKLRLGIREKGMPDAPLPGFDPLLSEVKFSFDVNEVTDRDLPAAQPCPPRKLDEPEVHYLAKDYASFRQLVLDRLALIMPEWRERHVPDLGITLVELLAYVGDQLSYYQDAVATEAYLNTARQRISVRRHVRLVDYILHEGCNARALLCLTADVSDPTIDLTHVYFITDQGLSFPLRGVISRETELKALEQQAQPVRRERYEVFEPVNPGALKLGCVSNSGREHPERSRWAVSPAQSKDADLVMTAARPSTTARRPMQASAQGAPLRSAPDVKCTLKLYYAHNRIEFYTWGERECCLPKGATHAALRDGSPVPTEKPEGEAQPKPQAQETVTTDATQTTQNTPSPAQVEAQLRARIDERRALHLKPDDLLIFEEVRDPGTGLEEDADPARRHAVRLTKVTPSYDLANRQAVLEIEWGRADALPFPLCLSAVSNDCDYLQEISVARGNVIVVDHGETVGEDLPDVEPAAPQRTCDECGEVQIPGSRRYNSHLGQKPLVFREAVPVGGPASHLLHCRDPRAALPQVELAGRDPQTGQTDGWQPRPDLLSSGGDDRQFVVEVDDERVAWLRFGDDEMGEAPPPGTKFHARYRVGEPLAGNVGAEAIRRLIVREGIFEGVTGVRNPLPAIGGAVAETLDDARLRAPHAFRQRLLRAITPEDYARLVESLFPDHVQRAFATLNSYDPPTGRFNVKVWFDPRTGADLPPNELVKRISKALYPYRRIGHDLTVQPGKEVLLDVVIKVKVEERAVRERVKVAIEAALGRRGFFCPDRLTFDTGISLSEMVTIVQRIPGVGHVAALTVTARDSAAVAPDPATQEWPNAAAGTGDDLMKFTAGWIPSLGTLKVE